MDSSIAILVVEDDPDIKPILEETLVDGGFEVTVATSGEEAIALLTANNSDYRALVTDIGLPGSLDGWDVARRAREIEAAFPVVYMSGEHGADWSSKGVPNSVMLGKPFAPAQLVAAVSNLLNSGLSA